MAYLKQFLMAYLKQSVKERVLMVEVQYVACYEG